jgi:hypothetical protein
MITLVDRSIQVAPSSTPEFGSCPDSVYASWIARVHLNKTPVNAGDQYVWLYVQLIPPRFVNCIITVKAGDEYPPTEPTT